MSGTTRTIPFSIATTTPRDTRGVAPAMPTTRAGASEWSEPRRRDWLASRLAARLATSRLQAQLGRKSHGVMLVETGVTHRGTTTVTARRIAGRTKTRVLSFPLDLSISVAHSEGHAIAGAAPHPARIGVDLERDGQIDPDHARYFLTPLEQRQLKEHSLTELWAVKESVWKALGCDQSTPLRDLELIGGIAGGIHAARLGRMVFPVTTEVSQPWPGWVAAVAVIDGVGE